MTTLVKGFASGGGSPARQGKMVDVAMEDLQSKISSKNKIDALTIYPDDTGIHIVAAISEKEGGKKK